MTRFTKNTITIIIILLTLHITSPEVFSQTSDTEVQIIPIIKSKVNIDNNSYACEIDFIGGVGLYKPKLLGDESISPYPISQRNMGYLLGSLGLRQLGKEGLCYGINFAWPADEYLPSPILDLDLYHNYRSSTPSRFFGSIINIGLDQRIFATDKIDIHTSLTFNFDHYESSGQNKIIDNDASAEIKFFVDSVITYGQYIRLMLGYKRGLVFKGTNQHGYPAELRRYSVNPEYNIVELENTYIGSFGSAGTFASQFGFSIDTKAQYAFSRVPYGKVCRFEEVELDFCLITVPKLRFAFKPDVIDRDFIGIFAEVLYGFNHSYDLITTDANGTQSTHIPSKSKIKANLGLSYSFSLFTDLSLTEVGISYPIIGARPGKRWYENLNFFVNISLGQVIFSQQYNKYR